MTSTAKQGVLVTVIILLSALAGCCEGNKGIITQPNDVTVLAGEVAVFTCVVDINKNSVNVMWKRSDNGGKATTLTNTDHYMISGKFTGSSTQFTSTLTITDVKMEHAGLYQLVVTIRDFVVMSRKTSLTVLTAKITTQPSDVTLCTGEVAVFTCVVDRNGTNITSDNVMWQQIRVGGSISTLSKTNTLTGVPFNITTTISGDILTSTLTITGVTDKNPLGTSLYRCVVKDMMSRDVSLHVFSGPPGMPMNIRFSDITNTSFVVQWDEVDDADQYIVNWRDDGDYVRESTPSLTPHTIIGLTPNTTYVVYVGVINACGSGQNSSIKSVTTKMSGYLFLPSCVSTSSSVLTTPLTMFSTMETMPMVTMPIATMPVVTMPMATVDSSSLSTGVAVAMTFTITFIITLTVSVVITFLVTFVIVKRKLEKVYKTIQQPTQRMPLYETVITPAITKSGVKLEANPAYGTSDRVVMSDNPAYQSCK